MSYLDLAKRMLAEGPAVQPAGVDREGPKDTALDAGELDAVKLTNTVVGDLWLVRDEHVLAEDPDILRSGLPVFLFDEIKHLQGKSAEELRAIAMVKREFPLSRVLQ